MWTNSLTEAYEVFECDKNITLEEAKAIYRSLAKKYHPDVYHEQDASEMMKRINYAYEIIIENIEIQDFTTFEFSKDENEFRKKQNEHSYYKNENAYMKREILRDSSVEKDYYCWDPVYESFEDFSISVGKISSVIITEIFKKYYEFPYGSGPVCFLNILCAKESQILFSLLRSEFIRPYYCLCRLTEQLMAGEIETKAFSPDLIGQGDKEYNEWHLSLPLRGLSHEGRTENIEACKEGDEVILIGFGDNPLYPEKIEVFDMHYNSLGTIPVEYAICITPLVQNGILEIDGVIDAIMTRQKRGPRAKIATIDVNLTLRMKHKEFIDWPSAKKDGIEKVINKCEKRCSEIAYYCSVERDIEEYMVTHFSKNSPVDVKKGPVRIPNGYRECVVHLMGTFGQFDGREKYDKRMLGTFNLTKSEGNKMFNPVDEKLWINSVITMTTKKIYEVVRSKLGDVFYCESGSLLYVFETSWTRDIECIRLKIFQKDLYIQ